jgi:hypothetical protein
LPKTAFVIGADEAMIEYSVQRHFRDLPEGEKYAGYPRAYLEKLIQVPFRIPAMGDSETRIYMTMLLLGTIIGETSKEFTDLLEHARDRMSKPWDRQGLDADEIRKALGAKYNDLTARAVALADQISPILASGTKGNPRQVKRFVNALNLRLKISQARGFGDAIKPDVLAKVMLAELFLPTPVFERIAQAVASSDDGKCEELTMLEKYARAAPGGEQAAATEEVAAANLVLDDWKARPEVMRWAAIDPLIGTETLKPYLFVINDRKSYVGGSKPLSSKLLGIMDQLMGGDFAARGATAALASLEASEVDLLFNAMKTKLLAEANLRVKPAAITGISNLVAARPEYQMRYIEVLEVLKADMIGAWGGSGYGHAIKDEDASARLKKLFERWKVLGSEALKASLNSMGEKG